MCRQRTGPSLGGEAGGRSLGFISWEVPRGWQQAGGKGGTQMNDGEIDDLWHELNVLRIVVAYLVSREANKSENPDAVLRTIADELHRQFDDNTVREPETDHGNC
jgi:hypothetical protein